MTTGRRHGDTVSVNEADAIMAKERDGWRRPTPTGSEEAGLVMMRSVVDALRVVTTVMRLAVSRDGVRGCLTGCDDRVAAKWHEGV